MPKARGGSKKGVKIGPSTRRKAPIPPVKGCDLCGDWPVTLIARCHPTAPLRAEMTDPQTLILSCYLPACGREVAKFTLASPPPDEGEG
jgi:hypothetical protein